MEGFTIGIRSAGHESPAGVEELRAARRGDRTLRLRHRILRTSYLSALKARRLPFHNKTHPNLAAAIVAVSLL